MTPPAAVLHTVSPAMVTPAACRFLAAGAAARNLQARRGSIGTDVAEVAAEMDLSRARLPPVSDPLLAEWLERASCGPHVKALAAREMTA